MTIQDDDSVVGFALSTFSISEAAGTATINVRRVGGDAGSVAVDYQTVSETGLGKATAEPITPLPAGR